MCRICKITVFYVCFWLFVSVTLVTVVIHFTANMKAVEIDQYEQGSCWLWICEILSPIFYPRKTRLGRKVRDLSVSFGIMKSKGFSGWLLLKIILMFFGQKQKKKWSILLLHRSILSLYLYFLPPFCQVEANTFMFNWRITWIPNPYKCNQIILNIVLKNQNKTGQTTCMEFIHIRASKTTADSLRWLDTRNICKNVNTKMCEIVKPFLS